MPPAVLARATEAFFTTRADRGGTGLGLAMAHAFAARSGGALLIDSTVGRGTCVRLVLPRAPLPLTADPELSGKLHEVRQRIRSPALKQALEMWGALCPPAGLPRPVAAEGGLTAQSEHCLVLEVDSSASPPMLRLSHIGGALARALGPRRVDDLAIDGSLEVGTLGAAYRRTLQARFPSYEYARISLGADVPAVFERLILPAAVDGHAVSHLIGIVYLSDNLRNGGSVMLSANTVMGVGSFLDVPAAELAERLNQLDETAMDRLSFGVIRLDASGKVVFYSDSEAKQSGFGDSHALGLAFFTQLAPCMAMPELVRKVEDAQGRGELDIIFDHVGDFADAERKLLVRMISAPERGAWVLLQRQDTPALH
jgi:photoactive yellow protein